MAKMKIKYEQSQKKLKKIVNSIDFTKPDNSEMERKVLCEGPNKENKTALTKEHVYRKLH